MMSKKFFLLCVGILFIVGSWVNAYNHKTDSLLNELKKPQADTIRVRILLAICEEGQISKDSALLFITNAMKVAEKTNHAQAISQSYHYLCHWQIANLKNYDTILFYCHRHLELMEQQKYVSGMALACCNLGGAFTWNSLDSSMYYNLKSIELYTTEKKLDRANVVKINLSNVYIEMKRYAEAINLLKETAAYFASIGNRSAVELSYMNMGECYLKMGDLENAEKSVKQAAPVNAVPYDICYFNCQLANVYCAQGRFEEANKLYTQALDIGKKNKLDYILYLAYLGMADVCFNNKLWEDAKRYKELSWHYSYKDQEREAAMYEMFYKCDSALGNYKASLINYQKFITARDSYQNNERLKSADALEAKYQNKEKQTQIELLDAEKKLQQAETDRQKNMRNTIALVFTLVVVTGVYAFSRYRVRVKQKQEAERGRISRDLHDDVGATLGSISIYSEVAKNKSAAANGSDMTEVLEKIGDSSREMLEKMNDIVWAVNPKNDSAEELIQRMKNFAALMLTPRQIKFTFDADAISSNGLKLEMQQRKNIFLIYKEALHNIIKYADAKQVKVAMNVNGKNLIVEIRDDGKGFNAGNKLAYNGNGIKNMQARAKEIDGAFELQAEINKGTSINISVPV